MPPQIFLFYSNYLFTYNKLTLYIYFYIYNKNILIKNKNFK